MTGKGHVPEENLPRYRRIAELAHLMSRMGDMASNMGEYGDANTLWAMGGKYKRMANELRADLPPAEPALPGNDAHHDHGVQHGAVAGDAAGDDQQQEDGHEHPVQHPESNH